MGLAPARVFMNARDGFRPAPGSRPKHRNSLRVLGDDEVVKCGRARFGTDGSGKSLQRVRTSALPLATAAAGPVAVGGGRAHVWGRERVGECREGSKPVVREVD